MRDAAHHPNFDVTSVSFVAKVGETETTIELSRSGADGARLSGQVPAAESGQAVEYYFGLKDAQGRVARTPREGHFRFVAGQSVPVLFAGPRSTVRGTPTLGLLTH